MKIEKNSIIDELMDSPFTSGGLTVNFSQNRVEYQDKNLVLQPKMLELLILLCAAQGKTLSKQTLITALWPDTVVGPDSLANSVTRLRKVLDDDAKNPQFIETVQRKGYRWLQDVDVTKGKITRSKVRFIFTGVAITAAFIGAMFIIKQEPPTAEGFPFPDLHIKRLAEGGYEVQVGIDGELTEERKIATLKEIKRITGEEHSDMLFTIDAIKPDCKKKQHGNSEGNTENLDVKAKDKKEVIC
jgi:DNA-binding winged helix-turn-helix (wHTH) protein